MSYGEQPPKQPKRQNLQGRKNAPHPADRLISPLAPYVVLRFLRLARSWFKQKTLHSVFRTWPQGFFCYSTQNPPGSA